MHPTPAEQYGGLAQYWGHLLDSMMKQIKDVLLNAWGAVQGGGAPIRDAVSSGVTRFATEHLSTMPLGQIFGPGKSVSPQRPATRGWPLKARNSSDNFPLP